MKTTTDIVQRLLDEKQITAEEAVILLTPQIQYVYQWNQAYPYYPFYRSSGVLSIGDSLSVTVGDPGNPYSYKDVEFKMN